MNNRIRNILENFIVIAIILVLIQTFTEDLSILLSWPWEYRKILLIIGFGFDLFFTIEFLIRFYFAVLHGRAYHYLRYERGWIDFLASIPLLLLNSGPQMLALISGSAAIVGVGGILNVLKVIKAIRIARILRLLRVLKIFKQIKYTDSVMAQRHVAKLTSLAVSVFVFVMLSVNILFGFLNVPGLDLSMQKRQVRLIEFLDENTEGQEIPGEVLRAYLDAEPSVLLVREDGNTLFSRYDNAYYREYFSSSDYGYAKSDDLEIFFDLRPLNSQQARDNLIAFGIIVLLVLIFLFYYSPHFAITISDPIHIMRRGMQESGYNLEIKIPEEYKDDEVYRLAALYNKVYLPLKDRSEIKEQGGVLDLNFDDIKDILEEEE